MEGKGRKEEEEERKLEIGRGGGNRPCRKSSALNAYTYGAPRGTGLGRAGEGREREVGGRGDMHRAEVLNLWVDTQKWVAKGSAKIK